MPALLLCWQRAGRKGLLLTDSKWTYEDIAREVDSIEEGFSELGRRPPAVIRASPPTALRGGVPAYGTGRGRRVKNPEAEWIAKVAKRVGLLGRADLSKEDFARDLRAHFMRNRAREVRWVMDRIQRLVVVGERELERHDRDWVRFLKRSGLSEEKATQIIVGRLHQWQDALEPVRRAALVILTKGAARS